MSLQIGRVLSNPSLIQAMIADTPLVDNPQIQGSCTPTLDPILLLYLIKPSLSLSLSLSFLSLSSEALQNPELLSSLGEPDAIAE